MNPYDPYAAPRAEPAAPTPYVPGGQGPWTVGSVLGDGWRAFGSAWLPLVFAPILIGIVFVTPMFVIVGLFVGPELGSPRGLAIAMQDPALNASILGWNFVQIFVYAFLGVGLAKMRLAAVRGEPVRFGALFSGGPRFVSMLGLQLAVTGPSILISGVGVAARFAHVDPLFTASNLLGNLWFLVLLLLQALGLATAEYFVVDRGEGPFAAIKSAMTAPGDERGRVFLTIFSAGLIAIAGVFCCGFPALVTMPYASVCVALLYTKLAPPAPQAPGL